MMFKRPQGPIFGRIQLVSGSWCTVQTELVVAPSPALYLVSGVLQRHEPAHVLASAPEAAVE